MVGHIADDQVHPLVAEPADVVPVAPNVDAVARGQAACRARLDAITESDSLYSLRDQELRRLCSTNGRSYTYQQQERRRRLPAVPSCTTESTAARGEAVFMRSFSRKDLRCPYFFTNAFIVHSMNVVKFTWKHPANKEARLRAMLRLARFQARGRLLRRPTFARLGDRSGVLAYLHRHAAMRVVCANPPDYPEMIVWRQALRQGDLFIDVGANIGSYAIWASELGAKVIALEPAHDTFALLTENVALNGYPVETIRAAAGASCGSARFTTGKDTVNRMDPEGQAVTSLVTVDSIVKDRIVGGMKIDVEGFEIEVLRGCERALSERRIKLIQLEWNANSWKAVGTDRQPIAKLLSKYKYNLYRPCDDGALIPITDINVGPDVFARPCE